MTIKVHLINQLTAETTPSQVPTVDAAAAAAAAATAGEGGGGEEDKA